MRPRFDAIHSAKKQANLRSMMTETAVRVAAMETPAEKSRTCPFCRSREIDHFVTAYSFDMSRCSVCGLIFCDPYPTDRQLDAYYNSEMKAFENEFFRDTFEARVALFGPRVDIIHRHLPGGRLLDVGAAIGVFLEALRRRNTAFDIEVCDRNVEACRDLAERFPTVKVHETPIELLDAEGRFDVVTMWDTLEHLVDLDTALEALRRVLRPSGILVTSTPNTDSFEWKIAGTRHVQLLPPGHVNLMSARIVLELHERCGFEVLEQHTLNASLDIGYVRKLLREPGESGVAVDKFLAEALFDDEFVTLLEGYLIEKKMAGNVVTVARRRD